MGEPKRASALAGKVRFLATREAYGLSVGDVEARETHMSWVFLTPDRAYKLKKPVRHSFLDFSTVIKRCFYCREELRLNRRLAPETYLRAVPLWRDGDGRYNFEGKGRVADWLVEMKRLRACDMLDRRIADGAVAASEISALANRLSDFYRALSEQRVDGYQYLEHLLHEHETNRAVLLMPEFELGASTDDLVAEAGECLIAAIPEIKTRIDSGLIIEGHGDLRPEHVWLGEPLQIIDCLEFSRRMRILDPYDEVNYLGLECDLLGASRIRLQLLDVLVQGLGNPPSPRLLAAYGAFRALLRARLSIAHLSEKHVRKREKWRPLSLRYLEQARRELVSSRIPADPKSSRRRAAD